MTDSATRYAPGWPGIPPRWTSSAKIGVGTALNQHSKVWFTLSHGILNEVYFPRVDQACTRDMGFIVTNGHDFFSEEKRHCTFENRPFEPGIPAYELTNTEISGRYRIHKEVLTDPYRNVVLQKVRFEPLAGKALRLPPLRFALTAPGELRVRQYGLDRRLQGLSHVFCRARRCHAGASRPPRRGRKRRWDSSAPPTAGRISRSISRWNGNTRARKTAILRSLERSIWQPATASSFWHSASVRFGLRPDSRRDPRSSRTTPRRAQHYVAQWRNWQTTLLKLDEPLRQNDLYRASTAVLRTHESKDFLGGIIASLSIPWGFNKGDEDLGGYHLVWPRDLVETAGALLAAGAVTDAVRVLRYLEATQEAAGNWAQNLWLDGRPYWSGIQMDETAFPILLLDLLRREAPEALGKLERWWPMVRNAVSFILRNGPVTQQDRWEEDARLFAIHAGRRNFRAAGRRRYR